MSRRRAVNSSWLASISAMRLMVMFSGLRVDLGLDVSGNFSRDTCQRALQGVKIHAARAGQLVQGRAGHGSVFCSVGPVVYARSCHRPERIASGALARLRAGRAATRLPGLASAAAVAVARPAAVALAVRRGAEAAGAEEARQRVC